MPGGGEFLNRNITIVIIILVLVVIAGYLVWLRSKVAAPVSPQVTEEEVIVSPSPQVVATPSAQPSATPGKEATGSVKQKTSTPGGTTR